MRIIVLLLFVSNLCVAQSRSILAKKFSLYDKIDIVGVTNIVAIGDSFMYGINSTPTGGSPASYTNSFINLFKSANGFSTIQNVAVGGTGTLSMINQVNTISYTSSSSLMVVNVGLNDIRRGGNGSKTLKQIEAGYLYYLQKHIGKSRVFSGSASVTRTGTFANSSLTSYGSVGTGSALPCSTCTSYSNTANSTWQYTFTGTRIGFIFFASDGVVGTGYGRMEVSIDGTPIETVQCEGVWYSGIAEISPSTTTNQLGAVPYMVHGLTNTSHTIQVKVVDASKYVALDYFFTPDEPANVGPIIFCEIPYLGSTGYSMYGSSTPPHNNATQAKSNDASEVIYGIVKTYKALGYKIAFARVNAYFDPNNDIDVADYVHPTNQGHTNIKKALQALMK